MTGLGVAEPRSWPLGVVQPPPNSKMGGGGNHPKELNPNSIFFFFFLGAFGVAGPPPIAIGVVWPL